MSILFGLAVLAACAGFLQHWTGTAVVATGAVLLLWLGMYADSSWSAMMQHLRLWLEWRRVAHAASRDELELQRADELCAMFAERYPHILRLPFRLTQDNRVVIAPGTAERACPLRYPPVPDPYSDLATVLEKRNLYFSHPLLPLLLCNRAVRQVTRARIVKEVVQGIHVNSQEDLTRLWLRFSIWEKERFAGEGGGSLLYREVLSEWLVQTVPFELWSKVTKGRSLTVYVDEEMRRAEENVWRRKRAVRLETVIHAKESQGMGSLNEASICEEGISAVTATVAELAERFPVVPEQVTGWLASVFVGDHPLTAQYPNSLALGYFLAVSETERVLFQVGFKGPEGVALASIERACVAAAREHADRSVVLSLADATNEVRKEADNLGVLLLPADALDRLLAYHADRMWHAVEWSLRTSRHAERLSEQDSTKNIREVLELGLKA